MSKPPSLSTGKGCALYALALTAFALFSNTFGLLSIQLLFHVPFPLWRSVTALALSLAALLALGFLMRDFRVLWQLPLAGLALAGVALAAGLGKVCFQRDPYHLSPYEIAVALGGLAVFAVACLILRKKERRTRKRATRPKEVPPHPPIP